MSRITDLVKLREEQAATLIGLIDQLTATFKAMEKSTIDLMQATFHYGNKMGPAIHGIENLQLRVKYLVAFKLFNDSAGRDIDLEIITATENTSAINLEVANG